MHTKVDTYDLILNYGRAVAKGSEASREFIIFIDVLLEYGYIFQWQYNLIYQYIRRLYWHDVDRVVKDSLLHCTALDYSIADGDYVFMHDYQSHVLEDLYE